jgi:dodecin
MVGPTNAGHTYSVSHIGRAGAKQVQCSCTTHHIRTASASTQPQYIERRSFILSFGKERNVSEHIYKIVELVGSSKTSIEDAVQNAIGKAAESLRNLRWFQVAETRGYIENGTVAYWQVTIKVGFTVEG